MNICLENSRDELFPVSRNNVKNEPSRCQSIRQYFKNLLPKPCELQYFDISIPFDPPPFASSKDTLVKFWDLDTQHCFKTLTAHRTEVTAAHYDSLQLQLRALFM